jgi:asparagine synthase (glutamine-hydrolysing)
MTRWLVGVFDSRSRIDPTRLAGALAPYSASVFDQGPLQIAHSGPGSDARSPVCLLDGFLDNAGELGAALELPADSSPEVLLAAGWQRWGSGLPQRMRGEFALLVWDPEHHEGLLARDQLGVRSMFLHDSGGKLCFACEIRHLLALLPQRPPPDPVSVAHWLAMGHRPGSATLYTGVRRLNPGAMLLLDRHGAREQSYWAPHFNGTLSESDPQLAARTRSALDRAVARRIRSGELAGVLMSGGLDSASVAAVATTQAPGRVAAYSAAFPEHPDVDESVLIEELRGKLHLGGATAEVRAGGMLASALESIEDWGLPLLSWGDFWAVPLLRAAAASGVTVTLGGDGGDELFGTRSFLLADRLRAGHPLQSLALAREMPGAGDHPARRDLARIFGNIAIIGALPYSVHQFTQRHSSRAEMPDWLRPPVVRDLLASKDPLAWKRMNGPRWWAEVAHTLTRGIEEVGVFEHQRRRAASAGLEARHPLFDLDLVELCLRLPPQVTFDRYRNRPVLRAAMDGLLPESVRMRPQKALFDSVLVDSLSGPDRAALHRLLSDPTAEIRAYVDQQAVERVLFGSDSQFREQPFRWMWQLWRLTTTECWLRAEANRAEDLRALTLEASPARVALRPTPSAAR